MKFWDDLLREYRVSDIYFTHTVVNMSYKMDLFVHPSKVSDFLIALVLCYLQSTQKRRITTIFGQERTAVVFSGT